MGGWGWSKLFPINIKKHPDNPPIRIPPSKFLTSVFFSLKTQEKRQPHNLGGLSKLYAGAPWCFM